MDRLFARASVSISDLKKNPSRIISEAEGAPVAILNNNKPSAYLIPAGAFEELMERVEDFKLACFFRERDIEPAVRLSVEESVA